MSQKSPQISTTRKCIHFYLFLSESAIMASKNRRWGKNNQNLDLNWPIKLGKVLQTSQFSVKSFPLKGSCWNFTLKFHIYFYLFFSLIKCQKMGIFSFFSDFLPVFSVGERSRKIFWKKNYRNIFQKYF